MSSWTLDALQLVPTLAEAQHLTLFTHRTLRRAVEASGWQVIDIGAFNGVAPFLAPISEALARATERLEARTGLRDRELVERSRGATMARADLHLGQSGDGEIFVTSRQDGVIRMLVPKTADVTQRRRHG